jgi:hypothetical protein
MLRIVGEERHWEAMLNAWRSSSASFLVAQLRQRQQKFVYAS